MSSVRYVQQIPNGDGSFVEHSYLVYDWDHRFYEISYCHYDDNEYIFSSFDLISECSVQGNIDSLVFTATMSMKDKGNIKLEYYPNLGGGIITRRIPTEPCKPLTAP